MDESTSLGQMHFLSEATLHGITTLELSGASMLENTIVILDRVPNMSFVLVQHLSMIIQFSCAQETLDFGPGPVENILHSRSHGKFHI